MPGSKTTWWVRPGARTSSQHSVIGASTLFSLSCAPPLRHTHRHVLNVFVLGVAALVLGRVPLDAVKTCPTTNPREPLEWRALCFMGGAGTEGIRPGLSHAAIGITAEEGAPPGPRRDERRPPGLAGGELHGAFLLGVAHADDVNSDRATRFETGEVRLREQHLALRNLHMYNIPCSSALLSNRLAGAPATRRPHSGYTENRALKRPPISPNSARLALD